MSINVTSGIQFVKDSTSGELVPFFPINSADDVYYDVNNQITLAQHLEKINPENLLVTVADDAARFALTADDVQPGYTVKVLSTGIMYYVTDVANLNSASGYDAYASGEASSVSWEGITDKPASLESLGDAEVINSGDVVTVAEAGKLLQLDSNGKLPADITGNAASATRLNSSRAISGVSFDGSSNINRFAICNSNAGDSLKIVDKDGFVLESGSELRVKFTNGNSSYGIRSSIKINNDNTFFISAVKLSDTKVLALYKSSVAPGYGNVCLMNISDDTISIGGTYIFNRGQTTNVSATKLSDTKVLVAYSDSSTLARGTVNILTIDGNSISISEKIIFNTLSTETITSNLLSDNKVLLTYNNGDAVGHAAAKILTITGDTITVGAETIVSAYSASYIVSIKLSDTKALLAYSDWDNQYYGTARILTISGDTITSGSTVIFNRGDTSYIYAEMITDTQVLIAYRDGGNRTYGTAVLLTVSGTTITSSSETIFNPASTYYISSIKLSNTRIIIFYYDGLTEYGIGQIVDIGTTNIVLQDKIIVSPYMFENSKSLYLDSKIVIFYQNKETNNHGFASLIGINELGITLNVENTGEKSIKRNRACLIPDMLRADVIYDLIYDGEFWEVMNPSPVSFDKTLYVSSWEPDSINDTDIHIQTLQITGLLSTDNGSISIAPSATSAQVDAAIEAGLRVYDQIDNGIIIGCSSVPAIDIPIKINITC